MPQINTVTQVGNREDISDFLVVADAKNTPVTSMVSKGKKPINTVYQWPVAGIPDPDTASVADGAPVTSLDDMSGGRALLSGRVSYLRRTFGVTKLAQDVTTPAGVSDEFKHAQANAIVALKRAIEAVFCGDQDSSLSGTTHTARGLGSWISNSAQSDLPVPAAYRTPSASIVTTATASLLESEILTIMQSIYKQTGQMMNLDGIFGTALKARISTFTVHDPNVSNTTVVRRFNSEVATLDSAVDVIKGDFGTIREHPTLWNAFNNSTKAPDYNRGYILDMSDLTMRANQLPQMQELPPDGSGRRGFVDAVVSLQVGSPLKHGKLAP